MSELVFFWFWVAMPSQLILIHLMSGGGFSSSNVVLICEIFLILPEIERIPISQFYLIACLPVS